MASTFPVVEREPAAAPRRGVPVPRPRPPKDTAEAGEGPGQNFGLGAYLAAVWGCRHFWLSLVRQDVQGRYRRSAFGLGWSLLHPVATALVMCTVLHRLFQVDLCHFIPFLMAGLAFWGYLAGVTLQGCQCFVDAEPYIRQHPLPLAVYPLRAALRTLVDLLIALAVVVAMTACLRGFTSPLALAWLTVAIVLLLIFGWSLAALAGYVHTVFRDTRHIAEVGLQALFYLTPVVYPPELLTNTEMAWLVRFNPLVPFLNLIRLPLLEGADPSWRTLAAAAAVTAVVATAAAALRGHLQRRVILYL
jgi:lipopolysaccharide transport system permease protein